jgi:nitrogen fixation NifU-like protein
MDDLYRDYVLDHYKNPHNFGRLVRPDVTAAEDNPLCGDRITIDLKLSDGKVVDVRFEGRGCAISQAAASILTDLIKGQRLEEIEALDKEDLLEELGIPLSPVRQKCALLSLKVLKSGVAARHATAQHWALPGKNGSSLEVDSK